jgi:probable rRNA maturation factor
MDIALRDLQNTIRINPRRLRRLALKVLGREGIRKADLSIVFVTSQKMRALNRRYHRRDYTTDVLAFNLKIDPKKISDKKHIEGEIIISTATALRNARLYKTAVDRELALYVVHGILHLLGYDDHRSSDIRRMRRKEQELLDLLDPSGRRAS